MFVIQKPFPLRNQRKWNQKQVFQSNTRTKNTTFVSFINTIIWGMRREETRGWRRRRRHAAMRRRRRRRKPTKTLFSLPSSHKTSQVFFSKMQSVKQNYTPLLRYRSSRLRECEWEGNFLFSKHSSNTSLKSCNFQKFPKIEDPSLKTQYSFLKHVILVYRGL